MAGEWLGSGPAQRPIVYPIASTAWAYRAQTSRYAITGNSRVLRLKNGGRRPALNVRGELHVMPPGGSYTRELYAATICGGRPTRRQDSPGSGAGFGDGDADEARSPP